MNDIIISLLFFDLILLILGLINPNIFKKFFKKDYLNRNFILKVFGISSVILFILIGLFSDAKEAKIENKRENIKLNAPLQSIQVKGIKDYIIDVLPSESFLREFEKIPNLNNESYLGIYVKNYEIGADISKKDFFSCPEQTIGQPVTGEYHLFLFQNNEIINDIIIPSPEFSSGDSQSISYLNTKENNNIYFGGDFYTESDKNKIEKTKLINFYDYTGDGLKYEFLLTGATEVCGHTLKLVAGYNQTENKALIYKINLSDQVVYWASNFNPSNNGSVTIQWLCGDHGSDTETTKLFQFNKKDGFDLISDTSKKCVEEVSKEPVIIPVTADASNGTYINVDGNEVQRPYAAISIPVGASAVCEDGTYSFSQHRQGTCSGHGGVAEWY